MGNHSKCILVWIPVCTFFVNKLRTANIYVMIVSKNQNVPSNLSKRIDVGIRNKNVILFKSYFLFWNSRLERLLLLEPLIWSNNNARKKVPVLGSETGKDYVSNFSHRNTLKSKLPAPTKTRRTKSESPQLVHTSPTIMAATGLLFYKRVKVHNERILAELAVCSKCWVQTTRQ